MVHVRGNQQVLLLQHARQSGLLDGVTALGAKAGVSFIAGLQLLVCP